MVNVRGILARALSISTGSMSIPSNVTLGRFGRKVRELKEPEAEGVEEGVEGVAEVAEVAELEICRREPGKKKVERSVSAVDNVECLLYVLVRSCTLLYHVHLAPRPFAAAPRALHSSHRNCTQCPEVARA